MARTSFHPHIPRSTFTGRAEVYARSRPSYPEAAFVAAVADLGPPVRAVDLGCGTGISTRLLRPHVERLLAIDPLVEMLEVGRRESAAGIAWVAAHAAALPVRAASLDLILCAQSFHWFATAEVLDELVHALRPGGRLALLWNVRDELTEFDRAFARIVDRAMTAAEAAGRDVRRSRQPELPATPLLGTQHTHRFANPHRLDLEGLLGRALSASYFPASGPERAAYEAELTQAFHQHQVGGQVTLAQHTELTLFDKLQTP